MKKLPQVGVVISTNLRRQNLQSQLTYIWLSPLWHQHLLWKLTSNELYRVTNSTDRSQLGRLPSFQWDMELNQDQQNCGGFGVSAMDILQPNVGCLKPRFEEHRRGGSALQPESELWSTVLCLQPARMAQDWLKISKPYQDRSFQLFGSSGTPRLLLLFGVFALPHAFVGSHWFPGLHGHAATRAWGWSNLAKRRKGRNYQNPAAICLTCCNPGSKLQMLPSKLGKSINDCWVQAQVCSPSWRPAR